jgi:hypothetical protein
LALQSQLAKRRHTLDAQLPVTDSSAALGQHFEELLAAEARAIEGCLACNCASGQLLQASAAVGDLCGPAGCSQLAVELLCPPTCVTASGGGTSNTHHQRAYSR